MSITNETGIRKLPANWAPAKAAISRNIYGLVNISAAGMHERADIAF